MPVILSDSQKKIYNRARQSGLFPRIFAVGESVYLSVETGMDVGFKAEVRENGRWHVILPESIRLAWTESNFDDPQRLTNDIQKSLDILKKVLVSG